MRVTSNLAAILATQQRSSRIPWPPVHEPPPPEDPPPPPPLDEPPPPPDDPPLDEPLPPPDDPPPEEDPPPLLDDWPPDEELEEDDELTIFISSCLTIIESSVVIVGDAITFLTSVWTSVEPVGDDRANETAAASVFSPSGVINAAFIWPDAKVSAIKRCIWGVCSSSRTAVCIANDGVPLLEPPPDDPPPDEEEPPPPDDPPELPPDEPPDDPPELPPDEPPELELPC